MNAAESKFSISDTATKTIEGGIRALVLGNKPVSVAVPCNDVVAAGATSIADIEKLMGELLIARDYLQAEGERVRRVTARYAHLTQTASASVKVIAESLGKWRNPELESQVHAARSEAWAPNLVHGGEMQPDPNDS
jgi:ketopantoate hydroxymethyltransferase